MYEPGRPKVAILANRPQLGSSSAAGESHSELFYLEKVRRAERVYLQLQQCMSANDPTFTDNDKRVAPITSVP